VCCILVLLIEFYLIYFPEGQERRLIGVEAGLVRYGDSCPFKKKKIKKRKGGLVSGRRVTKIKLGRKDSGMFSKKMI
jgi:hypothetical protein